ncbi:MAG: YfcE family phosphodiesterase [Sphingobacteriia bacterium]|nr:YfcE family phosphodiesterase [Sphingobacteriia bacterium]
MTEESMKKIIVLSDTHNNRLLLVGLKSRLLECDAVIHLGDYVADILPYKELLGEKLHYVKGNGDFLSNVPDEKFIVIGGVKFFITHGHRYNVKTTLVNVGYEASVHDCKIALYGHTHNAMISEFEGVKLINPGCFSRSVSGVYSYCYILIYGGKCYPKIVEIE